jgi:hypothetical protein
MQRDYFYIECPDEWPVEILKKVHPEEHNELFQFNSKLRNTTQESEKDAFSE